MNFKDALQTWKGINELFCDARNKNKHKKIKFIRSAENTALCSDRKMIGKILNNDFVNIGDKLALDTLNDVSTYSDFFSRRTIIKLPLFLPMLVPKFRVYQIIKRMDSTPVLLFYLRLLILLFQ